MQRGLPTNPSPIKGASSDRVGILAVTRAAETCDRCDNPCIARRLSFRGFREYRWGEGRAERFSGIAAELVRLNVDVILAGGTEAAVAAKACDIGDPDRVPVGGGPDRQPPGRIARATRRQRHRPVKPGK